MPVPMLSAAEAADLLAAVPAGTPVGVAVAAENGLGLALPGQAYAVPAGAPLLAGTTARLVWWRAATTGDALLHAGVRPRACWDLGAVSRVLDGGRRDDPASVWARAHGRPEPAQPPAEPSLLEPPAGDDPVARDDSVSPDWARERWSGDLRRAARWAALALQVQQRQALALGALPDPRPAPAPPALPLLTAYAESAAAQLAVELGADGLPLDLPTAERLIAQDIGPRPLDGAHAARLRAARDDRVLAVFGRSGDLRNPAQVRALLRGVGIDVPDTRSWRLEPHRATSPAVAALLDWRRAERVATTYGYRWLDERVSADGRLRGRWTAAEGAGRMTASAGLHNLPAALRSAVAAEPGHLLVRADLGQVEPRVLAVVSLDPALAAAAAEPDLYQPVARALRCDRPTAKVAVLAAMYGQTSGTAGQALARMAAAYPQALAYLHDAERIGREGGSVRTWGGRLLEVGGGQGRFVRNAVVQGAAAELFKVWAATVRARLPEPGRIVLCLHDELLLHVPENDAEAAVALLHQALAEAAGRWASGTGVRFVADVGVARRWSEAG